MDVAVDPRLQMAIDRLGRLPVLDGTVRRLSALAEDDETPTSEFVAVLESDQGLAADVLRYANSASRARPLRVRSIRAAATLAGRRAVARLALEAATCRFFERAPGNGGRSIGQLHLHAATVATCAHAVAARAGAPTDTAHLAGLLHDVGKLVLPLAYGSVATDAVAEAYPSGTARAEVERQVFGVDHASAGALVVRASGVDEVVEEAIAAHHGGPGGHAVPSPEAACVIVANDVVELLARRTHDDGLLGLALQVLGLSLEDISDIAVVGLAGGMAHEARSQLARLERLAGTDDLTGLMSRHRWLTGVRERLEHGESGSVLLCDVDHLGHVNDLHGRAVGDVLLSEVARALEAHGPAARFGEDDFAVWVEGAAVLGQDTARTVIDTLADRRTGDLAGLPFTVSLGVSSHPEDAVRLPELLSGAHHALREAKRRGRDRAVRAGA